jgi:hypothetical protein
LLRSFLPHEPIPERNKEMNPKSELASHSALVTNVTGRTTHQARRFFMLILPVALFVLPVARAQEAAAKYPAMAPLEQYLMADRAAEIALARSAAPAAISNDATVLVLGKDGYETVAEGKNGFTCLVERGWMSPFDSPDFWNPRLRGPVCYNPAAVRTILPYTINRTKLVLAGISKAQMHEGILASVAKGELPAPESGAMSYMMSKDGYLGDRAGHWHPHLMFHIPKVDGSTWGANLPGSPIVFNDEFTDMPEPEIIFLVPVGKWSDGTAAHKDM